MNLTTPQLQAIRAARAQCVIRVTQLSGCRTCGDEQARFEEIVRQLDSIISQAEQEASMAFQFSRRSLDKLASVHTDLQRVAERALQISEVDFSVTQGRRTLDEQRRLYGKGRTAAQCKRMGVPSSYARPNENRVTWIRPENGNHLSGRAIDVAPFVNGRLEWDNNGKLGLWPKIAVAFKLAAQELGVSIEWGGDWDGTKDRPHFELV